MAEYGLINELDEIAHIHLVIVCENSNTIQTRFDTTTWPDSKYNLMHVD